MRNRRPVLLRDEIVNALCAMGMRIDEARRNRCAVKIYRARAGRNGDRACRADRSDAVAVDNDDAILNDAAIFACHGDDARARERYRAGGLVGGCCNGE